MAREAHERRAPNEPPLPRLTRRQWAVVLLVSVCGYAGFALLDGEPALAGVLAGVIFAVLMLGFEAYQRRG